MRKLLPLIFILLANLHNPHAYAANPTMPAPSLDTTKESDAIKDKEAAEKEAEEKAKAVYKNARIIDDELIYRATFGRAEDVSILLKQGASPHAINSLGWPALVVAAGRRDSEAMNMVKALVEGGADVNRADINKNYPLIYAVKNNDLEMVKYLMSKGAKYDVRTPEGSTPREIAVKAKYTEMIAFFDAILDAERKAYSAARTTDRYHRMLYDLAYSSCSYQYLSYYYTSKQDKVPEDKSKSDLDILSKQIATSRTLLIDLFNAKPVDLDALSKQAMKMVFDQLEAYISNSNRRANGVGKEADKHERCDSIALMWQPAEVQKKVAAEKLAKGKKKKN